MNQTEKNTQDIAHIKESIDTIKNNHLHHIEKDMARLDKTIDKMDTKVWAILVLLVASTIVAFIGEQL